ncbi:MAG TPA: 8-amino-7-oxononanoate synthase [Solirubrobacterales bacterium]|nr:8-amino-7-oxononanoate synthase [Solirubrobacterales bacterium]
MTPSTDSVPAAATVGERLDAIRQDGLFRRMRTVAGAQGPRVELDGHDALLLCSNDYLSLASDPEVKAAAVAATERWGAGAGASRLVSGNMEPHEDLERHLAAFHGTETALLFGSGYLANTGIVAALARRGDVVFSDELNHASIIDGCRLAGAETFVYRHRDLEHLAWGLGRLPGHCGLIVTDGLFSMDGDVAQLGWLRELATLHGAMLMVDDAHAVGALGPGGRGAVAEAGLAGEVDVLVGTLGKALGGYGAYACVSRPVRDLLVNTARPLIFSTALPPAVAAAADAALGIVESDPARIGRLRENASTLRAALAAAGLDPGGAGAQIMPVAVGDPDRAVAICRRALDAGVYAQAIRPPTVPDGTSRLRLTVVADHDPEELVAAAGILAGAFRAVSADGDWSIDLPEPEPGELRIERHGWRVVDGAETPGEPDRSGPEHAVRAS